MLIIEKVLLLKSSVIFQNCKETDLIEIASICTEVSFDKNVSIFKKGDYGNCIYFIYRGTVSIHEGKHQIALLSDNEMFGELSLLDAEPRSATASTITECIFLKIEHDDFYDVLATNTDILKGIMKTLCKRLREQDRINVEIKSLSNQ